MQPNANRLPDNLLSKFSRIYVSTNSFKDKESGETISYERFCLEYLVKGEPLLMELPIKKDTPITPKDIMLLGIADTVDGPAFSQQN